MNLINSYDVATFNLMIPILKIFLLTSSMKVYNWVQDPSVMNFGLGDFTHAIRVVLLGYTTF